MLYVLGWVEYTDQFGTRHRAGYARFYDQSADSRERYTRRQAVQVGNLRLPNTVPDEAAYQARNNLRFVTNPRYNYDIEIDEQSNPVNQRHSDRQS
jgi:hypothetical protein